MNNTIKLLPLAAILFTVASCGNNQSAAVAATEEAAPEVTVAQVFARDVEQTATYSSTVEPYVLNNIVPQASGRIKKINAEVGDFVKAGQVLAEMDRANLLQAELQMKNNEAEYGRLKSLYEVGGISKSDLDAIELSYKVSKTTYENLLENTVLRSPVNGVVTARNYDKGDMYAMGTPIYTVQQIVPVKLYIGVSEGDYTKIKKGDSVQLTVDAFPGQTFEGKVNRLNPVIDAASHTFGVEIVVPNADKALRPGMYAKVTVTFGVNHNVVVPDNAVVKQPGSGERYVFVFEPDSTVSYRTVTLGRRMGTEYEILSGLQDGETIVTEGQVRIKDGVKVSVTE